MDATFTITPPLSSLLLMNCWLIQRTCLRFTSITLSRNSSSSSRKPLSGYIPALFTSTSTSPSPPQSSKISPFFARSTPWTFTSTGKDDSSSFTLLSPSESMSTSSRSALDSANL